MSEVITITKEFIDTTSEKLVSMKIEDRYIEYKTELPLIRSRKRKLLPGEENNNDPIIDFITKFTVEVNNVILNNTITRTKKSF